MSRCHYFWGKKLSLLRQNERWRRDCCTPDRQGGICSSVFERCKSCRCGRRGVVLRCFLFGLWLRRFWKSFCSTIYSSSAHRLVIGSFASATKEVGSGGTGASKTPVKAQRTGSWVESWCPVERVVSVSSCLQILTI